MSYERLDKSVTKISETSENNENYKSNSRSFIRERKMGFKDYVWYLIMQKGRTTSVELDGI